MFHGIATRRHQPDMAFEIYYGLTHVVDKPSHSDTWISHPVYSCSFPGKCQGVAFVMPVIFPELDHAVFKGRGVSGGKGSVMSSLHGLLTNTFNLTLLCKMTEPHVAPGAVWDKQVNWWQGQVDRMVTGSRRGESEDKLIKDKISLTYLCNPGKGSHNLTKEVEGEYQSELVHVVWGLVGRRSGEVVIWDNGTARPLVTVVSNHDLGAASGCGGRLTAWWTSTLHNRLPHSYLVRWLDFLKVINVKDIGLKIQRRGQSFKDHQMKLQILKPMIQEWGLFLAY